MSCINMPGGLIQIAAYGSQDLFLTGIPEITYYKTIYKKHTNFAMESIEIPLEGTPNFDQQITTVIPKIGDLLFSIALKIELPRVELINNSSFVNIDALNDLQQSVASLEILSNRMNDFFKYNFIVLNGIIQEIRTIGANWNTIADLIKQYKNNMSITINNIGVVLDDAISLFYSAFPDSDKYSYVGSDDKNKLFLTNLQNFVSSTIYYYTKEEQSLLNTIYLKKKGIENIGSKQDYFSWVEKIGLYLLKKCSTIIGGDTVSTFDSNYLDVHYQLNTKPNLLKTFNEMIGNVPSMTNYSNETKQTTELLIPLPFWYSRHNSNALPLIALTHHDVEIYIEFEQLSKCCFYNGFLNINDILKIGKCSFVIEYIFLDTDERIKFANYSHEYLIQNLQIISSQEIDTSDFTENINFFHPVKELIWLVLEVDKRQMYNLHNLFYNAFIFDIVNIKKTSSSDVPINFLKNLENLITIQFDAEYGSSTDPYYKTNDYIFLKYTKYYDGKYKILYSDLTHIVINASFVDYTNYVNGFVGIMYNDVTMETYNPIGNQHIMLHGNFRTPNKIDSLYFNNVVPFNVYNNSIDAGINVYSFCKNPNSYQPSGSCNFSMLRSKTITVSLANNYYKYIFYNKLKYKFVSYAVNYNVLRIHGGLGTQIFSG